ncbi:predicted protein [Nematostella vectensis]|uniref:DNA 3'-5' helicase n=1 Tax=Nematostella vectensis TaxID=45351 RepID=A7ST71_NEMVE|nr:predicted protein [Nematostella vectensis]|eukprot:XP_001625200.1 predicted protein [Nematostella vectensis]
MDLNEIKCIADMVIERLPETLNPVRNMKNTTSVYDALGLMANAGLLSKAFSNRKVQEQIYEQANTFEEKREILICALLTLQRERDTCGSSFAVYICPPIAFTVCVTGHFFYIVDTHNISAAVIGFGETGIVASFAFSETEDSKRLASEKATDFIFHRMEFVNSSFLRCEHSLTKLRKPHDEAAFQIVGIPSDEEDMLDSMMTAFEQSIKADEKPQIEEEAQEILWRGYATKLGGKFVLVVCPTMSLIVGQVTKMRALGINAVNIGPGQKGKEGLSLICAKEWNKDHPVLVYTTPEFLAGTEEKDGIQRQLLRIEERISLIVIDECHLIFERSGEFRKCFEKLSGLQHLFPDIPIMALTATLSERHRKDLVNNFLRKPVVLSSSINRPNIYLGAKEYMLSKVSKGKQGASKEAASNKDASDEEACEVKSKWENVVDEIIDEADGEYAIVFMDFVSSVKDANACMQRRGATSLKYHGKGLTENEKIEVIKKFQSKDAQFLIATEAYQVGTHDDHVNLVCHVGCPRTLTSWVQEFGRGGRAGNNAKAIIYYNEFRDDQRLITWMTGASEQEKDVIKKKYMEAWRFIYCNVTGKCLRTCLTDSFDCDEDAPVEFADYCCESCDNKRDCSKRGSLVDIQKDMLLLMKSLLELEQNHCNSEKKVVDWIRGCSSKDTNMERTKMVSSFFGQGTHNSRATWGNILRQAVSLGYVSIVFTENKFNKISRIYRKYQVSEKGELFLNMPTNVFVKDPSAGADSSLDRTRGKTRNKRGVKQLLPKIRYALEKKETWLEMTPQDYMFPGFGDYPEKFRYCADVTALKQCVDSASFIHQDCELSTAHAHIAPQKIKIDDELVEVELRRTRCQGVKVCDSPSCTYTVSKSQRRNRCRDHVNCNLRETGPCPVHIVIVTPKDPSDKRRWIGITGIDSHHHNHVKPSPHKLPSFVIHDIKKAALLDPSKKSKDLQKGCGMAYVPTEKTIVAANLDKIRRARNAAFGSSRGKLEEYPVMINKIVNFESEVQQPVDKGSEEVEPTDPIIAKRIKELSHPYQMSRTPYLFMGDLSVAFFMNAYQRRLFAMAEHLNVDMTFTGNQSLPYLINVVTFDWETLMWVPVSRSLLNKCTSEAHAIVFREIFRSVDAEIPEFSMGENLAGITVDFSDAEANGLEEPLGKEFTEKVLRGCKVHWCRSYQKVSHRVCKGKDAIAIFQHIASKIENLEQKGQVDLLFSILAGEVKVKRALPFITIAEYKKTAETMDNSDWIKAKHWKEWWTRKRHLQMFTKAYTQMTDSQWDSCPSTTNPVESINRESVPKDGRQRTMYEVLSHLYRADKVYAARKVAVDQNVSLTYRDKSQSSQEAQRQRKRTWRRRSENLARETKADSDPQGPPDNLRPPKKKSKGRRINYVGRRVNVETTDTNGNWEGWFLGTVASFNSTTKEYQITFDDFDNSHDVTVPENEIPAEDIELLD